MLTTQPTRTSDSHDALDSIAYHLADRTGGEPISPAASRAIRRYVRRRHAPDLCEAPK